MMWTIGLEERSVKYFYWLSHNLVIIFSHCDSCPKFQHHVLTWRSIMGFQPAWATLQQLFYFLNNTYPSQHWNLKMNFSWFLCQLLEIRIYSIWVFSFDLSLFLWSTDFFSLVWHMQSTMPFDSKYTASSNHLSPHASAAILGESE